MDKHKFNIFPEMQAEDYGRLKHDLERNGYDHSQPIYLYEDKILDGWNRQKACKELSIMPTYKDFKGSDSEAILFVMRTNKRRNLTSSQWAAIAAEADDIWDVIEKAVEEERRKKQAENAVNRFTKDVACNNKLLQPRNPNQNAATQKIAETFNTNRSYVSDAKKYKAEKPDIFQQIKSGEKTISDVKKDEKKEKLKEAIKQRSENTLIDKKPIIYLKDAIEYINEFKDNSIDLLITDPPYSTDVENIKTFAESWVTIVLNKIKPNGRGYICIGAYPEEIKAYLDILLLQDKFILDNPLIWTYRNTLGVTPKMKYNLNYQIILHIYSKDSQPLDTSITNEMFSVQDINAPDGRLGDRYHKWQKPSELARRFVFHASKEGDLVVDPFACTGTFLIEANKLNRIAYGCDNSKENLNIAEERGCTIIGK